MLQRHQTLKVISLQSQRLLVLIVVDDQKAVLLLFYLFLQKYIVVCSLHKCNPQVSWKDDSHDVYLLNYDTIWCKLFLELGLHRSGQLSLDISYSSNLDLLQKVSDFFIALFLKQLLKPVWSEVVEELTGIFLLSSFRPTNVEVDADINGNSDVVLGWNMRDRALEPDGVLGDHHCYSLVIAVAASPTWRHDTLVNPPLLLQGEYTIGYVQFTVATARVLHDHHNRNALGVVLRNQSWGFLGIICVKLDQVCLRPQTTLYIIVVFVNLMHH